MMKQRIFNIRKIFSVQRVLSLLLILTLSLSTITSGTFAVVKYDNGLCPHHPVHTAECGYVEAVEGHDCEHVHDGSCYVQVMDCILGEEHCGMSGETMSDDMDMDCCAAEEDMTEESASEEEHVCSVESGCIKTELDCHHIYTVVYEDGTEKTVANHDAACGYVEAVEGHACEYVCDICNGVIAIADGDEEGGDTEEPEEPEHVYTPEEVGQMVADILAKYGTKDEGKWPESEDAEGWDDFYNAVRDAYIGYWELDEAGREIVGEAEIRELVEYIRGITKIVTTIGSAEALALFMLSVNEDKETYSKITVTVTADIDLAELATVKGGIYSEYATDWWPIGITSRTATATTYGFKGTFDGQGHTIKNLQIITRGYNVGLFAVVNGGTIQNLGVECNIADKYSATSSGSKAYGVGGIVGYLYGSAAAVENCWVSGIISSYNQYRYTGGIVGTANTQSNNVKNCYSRVTDYGNANNSHVGGIVGYGTKVTVTNSYYLNYMVGSSKSYNLRLVGNDSAMTGSTSEEVFKTGEIAWNLQQGGGQYWGQNITGEVKDDFPRLFSSSSDISAYRVLRVSFTDRVNTVYADPKYTNYGGIITLPGINTGNFPTYADPDDPYYIYGEGHAKYNEKVGYPGEEFTVNEHSDLDLWAKYELIFHPGENLISTALLLKALADYTNDGYPTEGYIFRLTNDIDLIEAGIGANPGSTSSNWTPIGGAESTYDVSNHIKHYYSTLDNIIAFNGIFDGDGYTVKGVYMYHSTEDRGSNYACWGLFGYTGSSAVIENLTVTGLYDDNAGGNHFGWYLGGIVGYNNGGTVDHCYYDGFIETMQWFNVGGIVGYNYGGTVDYCATLGDGSNQYVLDETGALVENENFRRIRGRANTGGVVGANVYGGDVTNCYAITFVRTEMNEHVEDGNPLGGGGGGIVGYNDGTVENCYFVGGLDSNGERRNTHDTSVGPIVGRNNGRVNSCYYQDEVGNGSDFRCKNDSCGCACKSKSRCSCNALTGWHGAECGTGDKCTDCGSAQGDVWPGVGQVWNGSSWETWSKDDDKSNNIQQLPDSAFQDGTVHDELRSNENVDASGWGQSLDDKYPIHEREYVVQFVTINPVDNTTRYSGNTVSSDYLSYDQVYYTSEENDNPNLVGYFYVRNAGDFPADPIFKDTGLEFTEWRVLLEACKDCTLCDDCAETGKCESECADCRCCTDEEIKLYNGTKFIGYAGEVFTKDTRVYEDMIVVAINRTMYAGREDALHRYVTVADINNAEDGYTEKIDLSEWMQYENNDPVSAGRFDYFVNTNAAYQDENAQFGEVFADYGFVGDMLNVPIPKNTGVGTYTLHIIAKEKDPVINPVALGGYGTNDVELTVKITVTDTFITINKVIAGLDDVEAFQGVRFTFKVYGGEKAKNLKYKVDGEEDASYVFDENGYATVYAYYIDGNSCSVTLSELPAGEYKIEEVDIPQNIQYFEFKGVTCEANVYFGQSGTNLIIDPEANNHAAVTVTNTYERQKVKLTINKVVAGYPDEHTYTFTLKPAEHKSWYAVVASYVVDVWNAIVDFFADLFGIAAEEPDIAEEVSGSNVITAKVKVPESAYGVDGAGSTTIEIPAGIEYQVIETDAAIDGYNLTTTYDNGNGRVKSTGDDVEITVTNTYEMTLGYLRIVHTADASDDPGTTKAKNLLYSYIIHGPWYLNGTYEYTYIYNQNSVQKKYIGTVTFQDGVSHVNIDLTDVAVPEGSEHYVNIPGSNPFSGGQIELHIPALTYTITEVDGAEIDGYNHTISGDITIGDQKNEIKVTEGKLTAANISDYYERATGTLTITKTVATENNELPIQSRTYGFQVKYLSVDEEDPSGSYLGYSPRSESDDAVVYGDFTFLNNVATVYVEVTNGESETHIFKGLPVGTYTVTELGAYIDGYSCVTTYDGRTLEVDENGVEVTITNHGNTDLAVVNSYERVFGGLAISKTAEIYQSDGTATADTTGTQFTFRVTLTDGGKPVSGRYRANIVDITTETPTPTNEWRDIVFDEEGKAYVTLQSGQMIVADGIIPAGMKYTVEEIDLGDGWLLTSRSGESGTITEEEIAHADFVNTKFDTSVNALTVENKIVGVSEGLLKGHRFEFYIYGPESAAGNSYSIMGIGGVTDTITFDSVVDADGNITGSKAVIHFRNEKYTGTNSGLWVGGTEGVVTIVDLPEGEYMVVEGYKASSSTSSYAKIAYYDVKIEDSACENYNSCSVCKASNTNNTCKGDCADCGEGCNEPVVKAVLGGANGNHTDSLTVTNTYTVNTGDLVITKTLECNDEGIDISAVSAGQEFTFIITASRYFSTSSGTTTTYEELFDSLKGATFTYVSDGGQEGTATFSYGDEPTAKVVLTFPEGDVATASVRVKGLYYGIQYIIAEDESTALINGYTLSEATISSQSAPAVKLLTTAESKRTVTNTYTRNTGTLTVQKVIVGGAAPERRQTFIVKITAPADVKNGSYYNVHFDENGEAALDISLDGGGDVGSKTINNLPTGTYYVEETGYGEISTGLGLTTTYTPKDPDNEAQGVITVTENRSATVTVTNTYKQQNGLLTITKTVAEGAPKETYNRDYTVTIRATTMEVSGEYKAYYDGDTNKEAEDVIFDRYNTATFKIHVDDTGTGSITIKELPVDAYTVTEDADDAKIGGYILSTLYNGTAGSQGAITVIDGDNVTLTVTNVYEQVLHGLTIAEGGGQSNESFLYEVKDADGNTITVSVKGGGKTTILVPAGTYTITEISDWSWKHKEGAAAGKNGEDWKIDGVEAVTTITDADITYKNGTARTVTYTHTGSGKNWLGGENHKDNRFNSISQFIRTLLGI